MTRPILLSGRAPVLTEKAREAGVSGSMSVRCIVTTEGRMTDCKVVAGLPFMNDEVIEAVQTWRYTPATFNGKVVAVPLLVPLRFRTIAAEPEK